MSKIIYLILVHVDSRRTILIKVIFLLAQYGYHRKDFWKVFSHFLFNIGSKQTLLTSNILASYTFTI